MKNKRKIFESPIDEPTGFSINPNLKRAIERGETPLSNSPFIPKKGEDDRQSFEEIAASKRFRDVNTVSGSSTVWTSSIKVNTPTLDLGNDTQGNLRQITADNSIIKDDTLLGGTY